MRRQCGMRCSYLRIARIVDSGEFERLEHANRACVCCFMKIWGGGASRGINRISVVPHPPHASPHRASSAKCCELVFGRVILLETVAAVLHAEAAIRPGG